MGVQKTNGHNQIKIKFPTQSKDPQVFYKAQNEDNVVFCTFKTKIESQNLDYMCIKDHIQIKINMPNPSQEPSATT